MSGGLGQTYDLVMSGDAQVDRPLAVGFWEVLAFGCELAMLAALAVAGWLLAPSPTTAVVLAFALPALTGLVWGMWLAPRARRRLHGPALTSAKIAVYLITGMALAAAGEPAWGAVLAVVSVLDAVVLARRDARPAGPPAAAPPDGDTVEHETVERGTVERGTVEGETVERETVERGTVERGTVEGGTLEGGAVEGPHPAGP